jgi:hypothetical protein
MDKDNKKARLNALIAVRSIKRVNKTSFYKKLDKVCDNADEDHLNKLLLETKDEFEKEKLDRAKCAKNTTKKRMKNQMAESVVVTNIRCQEMGIKDWEIVQHGITYSVEEKKSTEVAENS